MAQDATEQSTEPNDTPAPAAREPARDAGHGADNADATPPWERDGEQFDPAKAWSLIRHLREDNTKLKATNESNAARLAPRARAPVRRADARIRLGWHRGHPLRQPHDREAEGMGGRGAASGVSNSGHEYGSEYRTLLKAGNIKFVVDVIGKNRALMETRTRGRIYVTVNNDTDKLKNITYFDTNGKRLKQISLDHIHGGQMVHVHDGYFHNEYNPKNQPRMNLTPEERRMVERVRPLWNRRTR